MFFSARAIDDNGVIYDLNEPETAVRQAMLKNTKRAVFLCDDTKFSKKSVFKVCEAKDLSYIVTNNIPNEEIKQKWKNINIV